MVVINNVIHFNEKIIGLSPPALKENNAGLFSGLQYSSFSKIIRDAVF
jgi:hypothetical protein